MCIRFVVLCESTYHEHHCDEAPDAHHRYGNDDPYAANVQGPLLAAPRKHGDEQRRESKYDLHLRIDKRREPSQIFAATMTYLHREFTLAQPYCTDQATPAHPMLSIWDQVKACGTGRTCIEIPAHLNGVHS